MRPSVDSMNSIRVDTPVNVSCFVPTATRSWWPRSGTSLVSWLAGSAPCVRRASTVSSPTRSIQASTSSLTAPSSNMATSLRRSPATSARVHEAFITAARSRGTTNMVRRIASMRSSVRRS